MVRHIVSWSFKDGFTGSENLEHAKQIKSKLEALPSIIDGIIEFNIAIDLLPSSNRNAALNSLFESEEALLAYKIHPEHKKVSEFVGSVMQNRVCIDYYE